MLRHLDKSLKILSQTIDRDIKNTEEKVVHVEEPPEIQTNISHDKTVTVPLPLASLNIEDISDMVLKTIGSKVTFPVSGTLATQAGTETLSNKTLNEVVSLSGVNNSDGTITSTLTGFVIDAGNY